MTLLGGVCMKKKKGIISGIAALVVVILAFVFARNACSPAEPQVATITEDPNYTPDELEDPVKDNPEPDPEPMLPLDAKLEYIYDLIENSLFTNEVIVKISSEGKKLTALEGWLLSADGMSLIKKYVENVANEKVTITDIDGLTQEFIININNIAMASPEFVDVKADITNWTSGNVTISGKAVDNQSGIVGFASGNSEIKDVERTNEYPFSFTATRNGTYAFSALNGAGRLTEYSFPVHNIDKEAPTIGTVVSTTQDVESMTMTITFADNLSGIVAYAIMNEASDSPAWVTISRTKSHSVVIDINQNGSYYIYTKDAAGLVGSHVRVINNIKNITAASLDIIIEEDEPVIAPPSDNEDNRLVCPVCGARGCTKPHPICPHCGARDCTRPHPICPDCGARDCTQDHTPRCSNCGKKQCTENHDDLDDFFARLWAPVQMHMEAQLAMSLVKVKR